jgi:hypothetical protein
MMHGSKYTTPPWAQRMVSEFNSPGFAGQRGHLVPHCPESEMDDGYDAV